MPADTPNPALRRAPRAALCAVLGALALATAIGAPAAAAADARYEGISADGRVAIFSTEERLVSGDTDNRRDLFVRAVDPGVGDYVTRQVSLGPSGGNNAFDASFYGIDPLGATVFFSTAERLTPDDTDRAVDVYMRDLLANTTARVSRGAAACEPACGNGSVASSPVPAGVSGDGSRVFFATVESLSPDDGDSSLDLYVRDLEGGTTELVSRGAAACGPGCGRGLPSAFFQGSSASGEKAYFTTDEGLTIGDVDGRVDIFERDLEAGTTRLVSVAGTCPGDLLPGQNCDPTFGGVSDDGSHAFFETKDRIVAGDTDRSQDVYDWSNGVATLASIGPDGGDGEVNALFAGSSPSGDAVFFETTESLLAVDGDEAQDLYRRSGGETTLVSSGIATCGGSSCEVNAGIVRNTGVPAGVFDGGSKIFFFSSEKLAVEDSDDALDVYLRDLEEGTTTLVSRAAPACESPDCGDGPSDASFARASEDGSRAFFVTEQPLVFEDLDSSVDVYERSGGVTTRVSAGASEIYGNGSPNAQLHGVSESGAKAFFVSREKLAVDDHDGGESDIYMRAGGSTLLVSVSNDPNLVLGPDPPTLEGTNPPSPSPSTQPAIVGQAAAGALVKIYTNSDCTGEIAATGTAEELAPPGGIAVEKAVAVGSTTGFWATAEAGGVTSDCSPRGISYSQQSDSPPPDPDPDPDPDPEPDGGSGGAGGGSAGGSKPGGIVYVTPRTRITFAPGVKTRTRNPVFRFTDSTGQEGTRFVCKIDRLAWRPCGSPKKLKKLKRGRHVFRVKARNAAGAWEPTPVKHVFKLVRG